MRRSGLLMLLVVLVTACAQAPRPGEPVRVILFIGDGVGTAYWSAARFARDRLAVEDFPVVGLMDTRSASHRVTDSAAGATVLSAGVRTYNGAIGVGPDSVALPGVLRLAAERGMSTGLVATCAITHATPAAFVGQVPNRAMQAKIAEQIAAADVTVLLGGGRGYFDGGLRADSVDLLTAMIRDYVYVEDGVGLRALDTDTVRKLLGLFAREHVPAAMAREPTLAEMTRAALAVLDANPAGFFVMIESSQPDWRGHENAPLDELMAEMLDFDDAIAEALAYRQRRPETLIIVVGDHETGGLTLVERRGELVARWGSTDHTAEWVPLFAVGPGAERFGGIVDNYVVGRLLLEHVAEGAPARLAARGRQRGQ
jgi:alkaline phosphatase